MTAFEYLCRPDDLRREIERIRSRIDTLRSLAGQTTAAPREVRVQTSRDPYRAQAFLAEAADEERCLPRLEDALRQAAEDTVRYISLLADERLVRLLALRYLEGYRWEDIAVLMNYSPRSVFRLHRQALALLPPPPEVPPDGLLE